MDAGKQCIIYLVLYAVALCVSAVFFASISLWDSNMAAVVCNRFIFFDQVAFKKYCLHLLKLQPCFYDFNYGGLYEFPHV